MVGRGAAEGGDDGVVVGVGVVRVVHCGVVPVVFGRSSGDADVGLAYVRWTRRLELACVVLLWVAASAVVVVALVAADERRVAGRLGEGHLPLVAQLGRLGVAQHLRALQGAVGGVAQRARAGGVVHLLAGGGRGDVNGEFGAARHRLGGLGAAAAHDGARLGVVEVVVVGGLAGGAQVPVVDAGGRHGVTMWGVGGPTRAGGVRGSVDILHLEGSLQS